MENDGDAHLVYECVAEPDLHSKELQDAYGCTYPEEIVEKLFECGRNHTYRDGVYETCGICQ